MRDGGVSKYANGASTAQVRRTGTDKPMANLRSPTGRRPHQNTLMITAIAGSTSNSTAASAGAGTTAPSGRGLDADLAKREIQLSDWVHCVSASTPRGKAKIEEISGQISDIKAKMKKAEQAAPPTPAPVAASSGRLLDVYA